MKPLYLLTEDDSDDLIYEAFAERVTGSVFTPSSRRMRRGSGIGAVRASLKLLLAEARRMAAGSGAHFVLAMDNDRAPHTAAADSLPAAQRSRLEKMDARKSDRHAGLLSVLEETLGRDRSRWPVSAAIAVPVEMIESWLLLIARGGQAADLPRFSRRDSALSRHFHQPAEPPPQLKDLRDAAWVEDGFPNCQEWALSLVMEKLDAADLAQRSPSFALFKSWLDGWPK